jgi:hypothetical protein
MAVFDRWLSETVIDGITWPSAEDEAGWSSRLRRACRILRGCTPGTVRSVVIAESCEHGEMEARAVAGLAERLAGEYDLVISVGMTDGNLKVRLSCRTAEIESSKVSARSSGMEST